MGQPIPDRNPPPPVHSPWGPLLAIPYGNTFINQGSCVALAGYPACGTAMNAQLQCEYEACYMPACLQPDPKPADLATCLQDADSNACASYVVAAAMACSNVVDGGSASFCLQADWGPNPVPLEQLMMQQCGIPDGGAPGDASATD